MDTGIKRAENKTETTRELGAAILASEPNLSSRRPYDPVEQLPAELFLWVIVAILPSAGDPIPRLLDLTSVSQAWQHFILSAKVLWSDIYITTSKEDLFTTISLSAHLAKEVPIHLFVCEDIGPEWHLIGNILRPLRQQISSLTILGDHLPSGVSQPSLVLIRMVSDVLQYLGGLPELQNLYFGRTITSDLSGFDALGLPPGSRLQSEVDIYSPVPTSMVENLDLFSNVASHEHLSGFASTLCLLPSVKTLVLIEPLETTQAGIHTGTTKGSFPFLTHLSYLQEYGTSLKNLIQVTRSTLKSLSLRVLPGNMVNIWNLLQLTTCLDDLTLNIVGTGDIFLSFPDATMTDEGILSIFHPVHTISPSLRCLALNGSSLAAKGLYMVPLGDFVSAIVNTYRHIEHLNCTGIPFDIHEMSRRLGRHGLVYLESLEIRGWRNSRQSGPPLRLPSLTQLTMGKADLLKYMEVPNLLSLHVTQLESINELAGLTAPHLRKLDIATDQHMSLTYMLDVPFLPELYSLKVTANFLTGIQLPPLSQITRITLHETSRSQCFQGNLFCMLLAYEPHQCSMLEKLEFNRFVEWDILFHMLERRNLAAGSKRIDEISLPFVPLPLQLPLVVLLNGWEAERPSDESISMEATRELIFDMTVWVSLS